MMALTFIKNRNVALAANAKIKAVLMAFYRPLSDVLMSLIN